MPSCGISAVQVACFGSMFLEMYSSNPLSKVPADILCFQFVVLLYLICMFRTGDLNGQLFF